VEKSQLLTRMGEPGSGSGSGSGSGGTRKESAFGSATCLKYTLCVYNFIFLLSGCTICGLGLWTLLEKGEFIQLLTNSTYQATTWLLVATGLLSVISALLGYTAIALESRCLLASYTILLVLVFMFESVIGLLAYVYQEQLEPDLTSSLGQTFILQYEGGGAVDRVQEQHQCCGVQSFSDWAGSPWQVEHQELKVPDSCCKTVSKDCGWRDHPSNIHYTGCIHRFTGELSFHLKLLGSVSLGIALLQVIGVLLTSCLFSRLHRLDKYSPVLPSSPDRAWSQHS